MFKVLLYPLGAGRLHVFGDMSIDFQSKRRRSVARVFLDRFYIIAVLKRQCGVYYPAGVSASRLGALVEPEATPS